MSACPLISCLAPQGGLTDLWLDDPYVVAASKLVRWAEEANAAGDAFPVWGTCLGHQLLQILATNASFEELLVETDAVVRVPPPTGRCLSFLTISCSPSTDLWAKFQGATR